MVLLTTTPFIAKALEELSPSTRHDLKLPEPIPSTGAPISHEQLISLSKAFTRRKNGYTLNDLLKGARVYIPPPPPKPEPVTPLPFSSVNIDVLTMDRHRNTSPSKHACKPSPTNKRTTP
jgi:hypothetical protein